ncbi:MAG TPA: class I SAM-dependent methyltransferase [Cytophagaceae bacterium]
MTEEQIKQLAAQLRKPEGEYGVQVGKQMNQGNAPMNLHTLAVLNPVEKDKILEIGMGNGYFVKNIVNLHPSIRYTGVDYSELMVEQAIQNNQQIVEEGRAEFYLGQADDLPFGDHSFNKIFTVNTLYFWEDRAKVLAEFRRVLSPEGLLIIAVRPKHNLEKIPVTRYGFSILSKDELITLLEENGFEPTELTEIQEPDQEIAGVIMKRETLIVKSKRS